MFVVGREVYSSLVFSNFVTITWKLEVIYILTIFLWHLGPLSGSTVHLVGQGNLFF